MDRDELSSHKNTEKEQGQYSAILTEKSLVNKGFIIWSEDNTKEFPLCGNQTENPEHLAARVANQNKGFASSCPLIEPAIIKGLTKRFALL